MILLFYVAVRFLTSVACLNCFCSAQVAFRCRKIRCWREAEILFSVNAALDTVLGSEATGWILPRVPV